MTQPLRIFIGYDSKEPVAFSVLAHSILARASVPVAITPITLGSLRRFYHRDRGPTESTEFSITRFLVPALCDYHGYALFMDCDMLCQVDIVDIWLPVLADPGRAVYCCLHDYVPSKTTKFLGNPQTRYPRKNWSSLMVFDCAKCTTLTPAYVQYASGLHLHRFQWTDDDLIGALPVEWNWLSGEYRPNPKAHILHFTLGGPWHGEEFSKGIEAELWTAERDRMLSVPIEVPA